jgi:hypothetical protein
MRLSHYIRHLDTDTGTATGPVPMRNGDPRDMERNDAPRRMVTDREDWTWRPAGPARRVGGAS